MEFIENNNYTERVYNVDINKDKLKELLNKIIKELNYNVYGEYILSNDLEVDFKNKKIISGACLPNGDDLFVNIKDIFSFNNDKFSEEDLKGHIKIIDYAIKFLLGCLLLIITFQII